MKNKNLEDIRNNIDKIDEEIVYLIAKRSSLVHHTVDFKNSIEEITSNDRIDSVIQQVRKQAISKDLSPNLINDVYNLIIKEMIDIEIKEFSNKKVF